MANDLTDILNKINGHKLSVLQLSKQIGVNHDKLYSYISGRAKPKMDDFVKLQNWYALILKEELIPGSTKHIAEDISNILNEDIPKYYTKEKLQIEDLENRVKELEDDKKNQQFIIETLKAELKKYKPPEADEAKNSGARTA